MPARSQSPAHADGTGRSKGRALDLKPMFNELVRLEIELWNALESRVRAEYDHPLGWFEVMQAISRQPGCRVHDIAAELGITIGGTSKLVDRIEAAGYCARRANPGDRRSSIISLTPAGQRMLAKLTATIDEELTARLGGALPERALAQLTSTLTRLRAVIQGPAAPKRTA